MHQHASPQVYPPELLDGREQVHHRQVSSTKTYATVWRLTLGYRER